MKQWINRPILTHSDRRRDAAGTESEAAVAGGPRPGHHGHDRGRMAPVLTGRRVVGWGIFAPTCVLVGVGGWLGRTAATAASRKTRYRL